MRNVKDALIALRAVAYRLKEKALIEREEARVLQWTREANVVFAPQEIPAWAQAAAKVQKRGSKLV